MPSIAIVDYDELLSFSAFLPMKIKLSYSWIELMSIYGFALKRVEEKYTS